MDLGTCPSHRREMVRTIIGKRNAQQGVSGFCIHALKNQWMTLHKYKITKNVALSHLPLPWSFLLLLAAERDRSHIPMGQLLSFPAAPYCLLLSRPQCFGFDYLGWRFSGPDPGYWVFRRWLSGRGLSKWHNGPALVDPCSLMVLPLVSPSPLVSASLHFGPPSSLPKPGALKIGRNWTGGWAIRVWQKLMADRGQQTTGYVASLNATGLKKGWGRQKQNAAVYG